MCETGKKSWFILALKSICIAGSVNKRKVIDGEETLCRNGALGKKYNNQHGFSVFLFLRWFSSGRVFGQIWAGI